MPEKRTLTQTFREGQFITLTVRWHEWNALAALRFPHRTGLIQAEYFVPLIDQEIKV